MERQVEVEVPVRRMGKGKAVEEGHRTFHTQSLVLEEKTYELYGFWIGSFASRKHGGPMLHEKKNTTAHPYKNEDRSGNRSRMGRNGKERK